MREILFRGKREHTGEWVFGSLIHRDNYCCILPPEGVMHPMYEPYLDPEFGTFDGSAIPIDPNTVGQFTGLLDKKGERIFEGDIVRWTVEKQRIIGFQSYYYPGHYFGALLVVRWLPAGFMLCPTNDKDPAIPNTASKVDNYSFWNHQRGLEIVGNIHDNPELLEENE